MRKKSGNLKKLFADAICFLLLSVTARAPAQNDTLSIVNNAISTVGQDTSVSDTGKVLHSKKRQVDSLVYTAGHENLLKETLSAELTASVKAAEELAALGLFAEALEMVNDVDSTKSHTPPEIKSVKELPAPEIKMPSPVKWHVTTSADYNEIIDTTPEQKRTIDSLELLSEQGVSPYSGYVKAGFEYIPAMPFITKISPDIFVSDQKAYLQLAGDAAALDGILLFNGTAIGEYLYPEGNTNDMVDLSIKGEITTRPLHRSFSLSLPLTAELSRFRTATSADFPFTEYKSTPSFEWSDDELQWNIRINVDGGYRNSLLYEGTIDSALLDSINVNNADMLFAAPSFSLDYTTMAFSAGLEGTARIEQYPGFYDPNQHWDYEAELRMQYRPFLCIEGQIDATYGYEKEYSQKSLEILDSASRHISVDSLYNANNPATYKEKVYWLDGRYATANPILKFHCNGTIALGLKYAWEQRWYRPLYYIDGDSLAEPIYIWETYRRDIPGIGILWDKTFLNGEFWILYEMEKYADYKDPTGGRLYPYGDSNAWGFSTSIDWQIVPALSLDLSADYEYNHYVSVSLGMSARF